jgi:hypothetical protein
MEEGGRLERVTRVQIMPDIVTLGNTRLEIREGENFTLKCDVLPGTWCSKRACQLLQCIVIT